MRLSGLSVELCTHLGIYIDFQCCKQQWPSCEHVHLENFIGSPHMQPTVPCALGNQDGGERETLPLVGKFLVLLSSVASALGS